MFNSSLIYVFGNDAEQRFSEVLSKISALRAEISELTGKDYKLPGCSPYFLFAYIFNNSFKCSDKDLLEDLCIVSELCLEFCLYSDRLIDGQILLDEKFYYETCVHENYINLLMKRIGEKNDFWNLYYKYYKEYVYAVTSERQNHFASIKTYSEEEFKKIAIGKQALTKLVPAALGTITSEWNSIHTYENVIDKLAIAMQLHDDLVDWKDDLQSKRYSWLLNNIILENNLDDHCSSDEVKDLIFSKSYDIELLSKANCYCEDAMLENVSDEWIRYVKCFQARVNTLLVDLLELRGEKNDSCCYYYRNNMVIKKDLIQTLSNVKEFIIKQQQYDFREMKSWFLDITRDDKGVYLVGGDVFQRAVLLNLILESADIFDNKQLKLYIDKEIDHILCSKSEIYDCGWVYIEGLIDNCPDLDTFSEILRIRCLYPDNEKLNNEVEKVLNKVFRINTANRFSTWIIEQGEQDFERISNRFGFESEIDVNANFISALNILNSKKYCNQIKENAKYLYSLQKEEGYWDSSWYVGKYYSGYVLSKTFKVVQDFKIIKKFKDFLIKSQNENGSWGSSLGNPLETSFAILALYNIGDLDIEEKSVLRLAANYLLETVTPQGYWYGCEFIKYGVGKDQVNKQYARYRSAILTTGFCMAAMTKLERNWIEYESIEI